MQTLHLYVYDEVLPGDEVFISNEIKEAGEFNEVKVHISSVGGGVFTGWTIGNIIAGLGVKTTALIEGYCGSIATYIALKCDNVLMADTARFMIHNAGFSGLKGNKHVLREAADQLDKIDQDLISLYVKKTGLSKEIVQDIMNKETEMTTEEAIRLGFVDGTMGPQRAIAKFDLNNKRVKTNEVKKELSWIQKQLKNVLGMVEGEPNNMALELADGKMLFVESEDGELEGKPVYLADEEGNATDTPAPDGTHDLVDGRSITVEGGVVVSVQEAAAPENEELKEMMEKIKSLEEEKTALEQEVKEAKAQRTELSTVVKNLVEKVDTLMSATTGAQFKADKPLTQPKNKSVTEPQPTGHHLDGLASKLMQRYK